MKFSLTLLFSSMTWTNIFTNSLFHTAEIIFIFNIKLSIFFRCHWCGFKNGYHVHSSILCSFQHSPKLCSVLNQTWKPQICCCIIIALSTLTTVYNMYPIVSLFPANVTITIFTPCFVVDVFVCWYVWCKEKEHVLSSFFRSFEQFCWTGWWYLEVIFDWI